MDVQDFQQRITGATLILALLCLTPVDAKGAESGSPSAEYGALGGWVRIPFRARKKDNSEPSQTSYASPVGVRVEVVGTNEHFVINNEEGFFVVRAPLMPVITLKITGKDICNRTYTVNEVTPRHLVKSPIRLTRNGDIGYLDEKEIREYVAEYRSVAELGRAEGNPELVRLGEDSLRRFGDFARALNDEAVQLSANDPEEAMRLHQLALWIHREAPVDEAAYAISLTRYLYATGAKDQYQEAISALNHSMKVNQYWYSHASHVASLWGYRLPEVFYFKDDFPADRSEVGLLEVGKESKTLTVVVAAGRLTKFQISGAVGNRFAVTILNKREEVVATRTIAARDEGITWTATEDGVYYVRVDETSGAEVGVYVLAQITAKASIPCHLQTENFGLSSDRSPIECHALMVKPAHRFGQSASSEVPFGR